MDEQEIKAPPPKKGRGRAKKAQTMPDPELIPVQAETSNRQVMSKSPSKTKQAEGSVFASTEVHSEKQGDGAEDGAFEEPKAKNGWKKTGKKVPDDLEETSKEAKQMNSPTVRYHNLWLGCLITHTLHIRPKQITKSRCMNSQFSPIPQTY